MYYVVLLTSLIANILVVVFLHISSGTAHLRKRMKESANNCSLQSHLD